MHSPYISYSIFNNVQPIELVRPNRRRGDYCISANIILITGGLLDTSSIKSKVLRTGLIGLGKRGWTIGERVVNRLINPEDHIIIVKEAILASEHWIDCPKDAVTINETNTAVLLTTSGSHLNCCHWCNNVLPACLDSLFAFADVNNIVGSRLASALSHNGDALDTVYQFNRVFEKEPALALADLEGWTVWASFGAADGEDMVVVVPSVDEHLLLQVFKEIGDDLGISVFCGGTWQIPDPPTLGLGWDDLPRFWQCIRA